MRRSWLIGFLAFLGWTWTSPAIDCRPVPAGAMCGCGAMEAPEEPSLESSLPDFKEDGSFEESPEDRALRFELDVFTGYLPGPNRIYTGLLWPFYISTDRRWRAGLQLADDIVGLGVARRVIPVIDVSVGISVVRDVDLHSTFVGGYVSLFKW